ncbi:MAG: hypothetical protein ABIZ80_14825, partial [Bryobacteraceae bacterium]
MRKLLKRPMLLFLLSFGVYQANLHPVASADSIPSALLPIAIWSDGTLRLDRFATWLIEQRPGMAYAFHERDGHYYSAYPIAQPLLLFPFYIPVLAAAGVAHWETADQVLLARVLEKLFASLLAAGTVAALYCLLKRISGPSTALLLACAFAFGTQNWATSSQALWQHAAGALFLVLAALGLARWSESPARGQFLLASGLSAAIATLIRPSNILLAGAIVAALLLSRAGVGVAVRFATFPAIAACLLAVYNGWLFGDVRGLYSSHLTPAPFLAAVGLLVSPARGLFVYCPFLLLAIPGAFSRAPASAAALCRTVAIV